MPFRAETPPANRRPYTLLVLLLAAVAGDVNATGFFAVGVHTSHMTGNTAAVGEMLASGHWEAAEAALRVVFSFFVGAFSASLLLDASRHRPRGRHAAALLLEAVLLAAVAVWLSTHPSGGIKEPTLAWGLSFAMGLQNALVTRVSGAVVRTSHVTGIITDIGIETVRMGTWVRDGARGQGARGLWKMLRALPSAVQFERVRLHLGLWLAFACGGTLGPLLYLTHGPSALALPCAVVVLLAALDMSPAGAHMAQLQSASAAAAHHPAPPAQASQPSSQPGGPHH